MKPIEETHPSLSQAYFERNDRFPKYVVEVEFVKEHTMDKAVLREVLNKATEGYEDGLELVAEDIREALIKELGLEEE